MDALTECVFDLDPTVLIEAASFYRDDSGNHMNLSVLGEANFFYLDDPKNLKVLSEAASLYLDVLALVTNCCRSSVYQGHIKGL